MKPLKDGEVWEWAEFLGRKWKAFALEKGLGGGDGTYLRAFMAGGYAVLDAILQLDERREKLKKMSDNEYASNYPQGVKQKEMVNKVRAAGRFAAKTAKAGTGIGKPVQPVSPGKKKKKK